MGDPTLRVYPIKQIAGVKTVSTCSHVKKSFIRWDATQENADSVLIEILQNGSWKWMATASSSDTIFRFDFDTGTYVVSVRPKKLLQSASGTWWDLGAREIRKFRVNSLPNAKIAYSKQGGYCYGDSAQIQDVDTSSPYKKSWQWAVGNKKLTEEKIGLWQGAMNTSGKIDVFLTVLSDSGCATSYTDSFLVHALPEPTIQGDSQYCQGDVYRFTFKSIDPNKAKFQRWYIQDTLAGTEAEIKGISGAVGNYTVVLHEEDMHGCLGHDTFTFISKRVPSKPVIDILQNALFRGDTLTLRARSKLDAVGWDFVATGLTVLRKDSLLSVVIPQGGSGYDFAAWATAEKEGCYSDTTLWRGYYEFNSISGMVAGKCLVSKSESGIINIAVINQIGVRTAEVWTIGGAKLVDAVPLLVSGDELQATLRMPYSYDGVVLLLLKDGKGNVLISKKLF